jgi:hypothetical protein
MLEIWGLKCDSCLYCALDCILIAFVEFPDISTEFALNRQNKVQNPFIH